MRYHDFNYSEMTKFKEIQQRNIQVTIAYDYTYNCKK